jgi:hypothetical protein
MIRDCAALMLVLLLTAMGSASAAQPARIAASFADRQAWVAALVQISR